MTELMRDLQTSGVADGFSRADWAARLRRAAYSHPCASHPLFALLETVNLSPRQIAALLRNYDEHATVLRRLLLKAATIMPEEAVGYILENVRNEYGNGNPDDRHQLQLIDLAVSAGVSRAQFDCAAVQPGVMDYIDRVRELYYSSSPKTSDLCAAATAGGAIAATELMALREFQFLQIAFGKLGLEHHIWFNHLDIEAEHSDESLDLALFFIEHHGCSDAVEHGLQATLNANVFLYDGLLAAIKS